jgi:Fe-S cluster biogenesis protein NfuA
MSAMPEADSRNARFAARVREAIVDLRPLLPMEHAHVELVQVQVDDGEVVLRLEGSCTGCHLSVETLREGITAHLRRAVPEIRRIRSAD